MNINCDNFERLMGKPITEATVADLDQFLELAGIGVDLLTVESTEAQNEINRRNA